MPRVLGGFAVIPTGSTLRREIRDPRVRAQVIRLCTYALHALEEGLVDARDDTATDLHQDGMPWDEIARRFRVGCGCGEVLQSQPDASTIYQATVRRGQRRTAEQRRAQARRATDARWGRAHARPQQQGPFPNAPTNPTTAEQNPAA